MHKGLSISIVNYKSGNKLRKCINSILKNAPSCPYEILIFNNDKKYFNIKGENIKISNFNINYGFGYGHNYNACIAKYDVIMLLNPDTKIVNNRIWRLIEKINTDSTVGIISTTVLSPKGIEKSFSLLPTPGWIIISHSFLSNIFPFTRINNRYWLLDKYNDNREYFESQFVSGVCMLMKCKTLISVRGFNMNYFLYYEDVDLCFKILNRGKKNYIYKYDSITHSKHGSNIIIKKRNEEFYRSRKKYFYNNFPGLLTHLILFFIGLFEYLSLWKKYLSASR